MRTLVRFLLWSVIIIGSIIGVARLTVIRWVRIPEDDPIFAASIRPTIWEGDLILTWRMMRPTFGDLVLCPEPNYPSRYVIGRIAGEAGDRVSVQRGVPTTNDKPYKSERNCDPGMFTFPHPSNEAEEVSQTCGWEAMANHLHKVGEIGQHLITQADVVVDVPEGKWFLLSDNRVFPYDSRDYGFVDVETCKETVVGRLVSKKGWMDSKNRLNYIQ